MDAIKIIQKWIEPKKQIPEERKAFSNLYLKNMIIPLMIEQLLIMLVGIADTLMISYAGEAAVSGVSLVNMFVTIFVYIFAALASGGAVVVSQYIGKKNSEKGNLAAAQLMTITSIIAVVSMVFILAFGEVILGFLYGSVDEEVMVASLIYLRISAYSFIGLSIYNAGTALFRSMGKTVVTMYVSIGMNILNVIGNAIGIFVLKAGVAGVAWPSFIARNIAALVMIYLCFQRKNQVSLQLSNLVNIRKDMIWRIMKIAIPNSIEQGMFQIAKVILGAVVALFGTSQIAAYGVAQSIWGMAALVGIAFNPVFTTVIGQNLGSDDPEAAQYYMMKLLRIAYIISILWNSLILVITPFMMMFYNLTNETKQLVILLVVIHNLFNAFVFPISMPFANGLRAAGDVRYTMYVSIFATVICRVAFSFLFGVWMDMGVIGIALAMGIDWCIRAVLFMLRYKSGKWLQFEVI